MARTEIITVQTFAIGTAKPFAVPPSLHIGNRTDPNPVTTVKWIAAGVAAKIWIPNADQVFDPPTTAGFSFPADIPAGGYSLNVKAAPANGNYPYVVFCTTTGTFAQGGSEPDIEAP